MKVTIIKDGGVVVKDVTAFIELDLSALASNFHALQWNNDSGDLETKDANGNHANTTIDDLTPYQFCLDAWQAASDAGEAAIEALPAWLAARIKAYGPVDAQIEYITENGLEAWQTHVASIKTANPKP